jgi:hypothetical protein
LIEKLLGETEGLPSESSIVILKGKKGDSGPSRESDFFFGHLSNIFSQIAFSGQGPGGKDLKPRRKFYILPF